MRAVSSLRSATGLAALLVVCAAGLLGCQTTAGPAASPSTAAEMKQSMLFSGKSPRPVPQIEADQIAARDDVVSIHHFWHPSPWIRSGDRVVGFQVPVYFVSGETEKGAFVSGEIQCTLSTLTPREDGRLGRRVVHEWHFDEAQAMAFRSRKRAVGGYFYGFILTWPQTLDLGGQHVEIVFSYVRGDGRAIAAAPRRLNVPIGAIDVPVVDEPPEAAAREPERAATVPVTARRVAVERAPASVEEAPRRAPEIMRKPRKPRPATHAAELDDPVEPR